MKNIDRLEDFVKTNREKFDNLEPSPEVWGKIQGNVDKVKKIRLQTYIVRVAAIIAIVAVSAILINNTLFRYSRVSSTSDPEINELLDTEKYYAQKVNGKLKEIRKCYATFPDIKDEVETDLNELESMYNSLKNDLKDNISNKTVIEAMIENNRNRLELVDSILEQVEC
ncbi:MAG: hypothetical protein JXR31_16060 [Prolixibacteraceae bacterium]|nr:hypothetical protein [Prolixibacteraceae bacterium]MBN2775771.1 hypothetical protein [Prolixibacteraceae bacterium]